MSDEARRRILSACFRFLLPIARILLTHGISYREFDGVCRQAFVQTAARQFGIRGRETNTARVAAMTGIPRKQVQVLRATTQFDGSEASKLLSPLADLLHVWSTSEEFLDAVGRPRALETEVADGRSFPDLVQACMGDMPSGAAKAELIRLGAVSVTPNGLVELRRRSLIPDDVCSRLESAMEYSLQGLAKTIAHNVSPDVPESARRFERFVESRPLTESEVEALRTAVGERLTEISEELDVTLNEPAHHEQRHATRRVGVGLYFTE